MNDGVQKSVAGAVAPLLFLGMIALAIAQLVAGYAGIQHHLGAFWAFVAVALAFFARFTLPLTIGAFFGAMDVWGWPWYWALAFATPGLALMALMIPGVLAASLALGRKG
jgi:hypothetical protein